MQKDTKDWTWVLDRPCPECGFEAAGLSREAVAGSIRANASAWPAVLARPDAKQRRSPDVWSPLEYGCHVRDVFRIYDQRLERMLTEDDPLYPNWDQDQTAIDDRYAEQDPAQVADELLAAGAALAGRFDTVAGDAWQRTGRRSDGAAFTIESFGQYLVHDPVHHLHDVGAAGTTPEEPDRRSARTPPTVPLMTVTLRSASTEDVAAVLRLWIEADAEPTHTDDVRSVTALIETDSDALVLAEEDGALVGSVIAGWDGWRGSIYRLVVAPSHRRQGLARRLLAEAERRLDQRGAVRCQAIVVSTDPQATAFWHASTWTEQPNRARFVRG